MNTGINLYCSEKCDTEEAITAAKEAGFSHVSLSAPLAMELIMAQSAAFDRFANLLAQNSLQVDWIHVPFVETHFYHPHDEFRVHALATALQCLRLAQTLKAGNIVCHPVSLKFSEIAKNCTPQDIRQRLDKVFARLAEEAQRCGIKVTLENLRHPASHRILAQLIEDVPELAICFECGHNELTRTHHIYLGLLADKIKCLHLADNFGWQDDHLPPGDGAIDFKAILKNLKQTGYQGVWCMEIEMTHLAREQSIKELFQHARTNLMRIMDDADITTKD